jgi:hypothetical protein
MLYFISLFFANSFGWMDFDDAFVLTMAGANVFPFIIKNHNKNIVFLPQCGGAVLRGVLFSIA